MKALDFDTFSALTFDCYGTLIDWETGVISALRRVLSAHRIDLSDDEILGLFHEFDEDLISGEYVRYRNILAEIVRKFGAHFRFLPAPIELNALASSVPKWKPFPDTNPALEIMRPHYKLAIISNIDDDLFAETANQLQIPFDHVITAEQVRAYKPSWKNFHEAMDRLRLPGKEILHIAEGSGEIAPARSFGFSTVWVRRFGRSANRLVELPDIEVPDLKSLVSLMELD